MSKSNANVFNTKVGFNLNPLSLSSIINTNTTTNNKNNINIINTNNNKTIINTKNLNPLEVSGVVSHSPREQCLMSAQSLSSD